MIIAAAAANEAQECALAHNKLRCTSDHMLLLLLLARRCIHIQEPQCYDRYLIGQVSAHHLAAGNMDCCIHCTKIGVSESTLFPVLQYRAKRAVQYQPL